MPRNGFDKKTGEKTDKEDRKEDRQEDEQENRKKTNMKTDIKTGMKTNMKTDIKTDINANANMDVKSEAKKGSIPERKARTEEEMRAEEEAKEKPLAVTAQREIEIDAGVEAGIETGKEIEEAESIDKRRQGLMNLIRRVHGMVENADIEKHRQSQDHIGTILSNTKAIEYREVDIDGMYGEWVGVNRAHMKKYVLLHCHGGGYSTGSSLYARTLTSKLAESTSMDVLCFDYRLAPEHPYPAALEDAMRAWNYLMLLGYGARDVIVTGDSAGGNLALALTLKLKQEKRLLPRGVVLMSPWTDLTSTGKSFQTKAEADPVLNCAYIDRMVQAYAGDRDLTDPLISPLFGDFEGFPPAYIQVGENEILLSDALRLHRTFVEKNVPVKIDIYPGMWHVFQMSPVKAARAAMDKNAEFIFDVCR